MRINLRVCIMYNSKCLVRRVYVNRMVDCKNTFAILPSLTEKPLTHFLSIAQKDCCEMPKQLYRDPTQHHFH